MYKYENNLFKQGIQLIAGIDEVGRGCLAGPIVCAIVILPKNYHNKEIKDSKLLSETTRVKLSELIKNIAIDYHIEFIDKEIVDKMNPKQASIYGMSQCIKKIKTVPEHILIDYEKVDSTIPTTSIVKGDQQSISIASASILAKVARDEYMKMISEQYPHYGLSNNKGYGTKQHLTAIEMYGICQDIHRLSYSPIKRILNKASK